MSDAEKPVDRYYLAHPYAGATGPLPPELLQLHQAAHVCAHHSMTLSALYRQWYDEQFRLLPAAGQKVAAKVEKTARAVSEDRERFLPRILAAHQSAFRLTRTTAPTAHGGRGAAGGRLSAWGRAPALAAERDAGGSRALHERNQLRGGPVRRVEGKRSADRR
jgi:hypothetical protein